MDFSRYKHWVFNEWGVPHDFYFLLMGLLVAAPCFFLLKSLYPTFRPFAKNFRDWSVFAFLGTVASLIYFATIGGLAAYFDVPFISVSCYVPALILGILLPISFFLMITRLIFYKNTV